MKYKITEKEQPPAKKRRGTLSARRKMLLLVGWTVICVSLYIALSKQFATTTVQVCEVLLLALLCGYFYLSVKLRAADEKKVKKLEDRINYIIILALPLIGVIAYDFLTVTLGLLTK